MRKEDSEIERQLWHGTTESTVKSICAKGFNRSYCGKNGKFIKKRSNGEILFRLYWLLFNNDRMVM